MVMSQECLICYTPIKKISVADASTFFGTTGHLSQQLSVVFTVRKLLKVPEQVCGKLLEDLGNPSDWGISYCARCTNNIEEAKFLSERLEHLQSKLSKLSVLLRTDLLQSIEKIEETCDNNSSHKWHAIDEIRFQFSKWYRRSKRENMECDIVQSSNDTLTSRTNGNFDTTTETYSDNYENHEDLEEGEFIVPDDEISIGYNDEDATIEENTNTTFYQKLEIHENIDNDSSPASPEQYSGKEDSDEEYVPRSKRRNTAPNRKRKKKITSFKSKLPDLPPGVTVKLEVNEAAIVDEPSEDLLRHDQAGDEAVKQLQLLQSAGDIRTRVSGHFVGHQETIYECSEPHCNFKFKCSISRDAHERRMHQGVKNAFNCSICSSSFGRKCDLEEHLKYHLPGSNYFLCPKCPSKFNNKIRRNAHLQRAHYGETHPYLCGKCGKKFMRPGSLEVHLRMEHQIILKESISDTKRLEFNKLRRANGYSMRRPAVLKANRNVKCSENKCNFMFPCEVTRDAHVQRFHYGVKSPYKCTVCPKKFIRHAKLLQHMKMHEDGLIKAPEPVNLTCKECDKVFKSKKCLQMHMLRNSHGKKSKSKKSTNTEAPDPAECKECNKFFKNKSALQQHILTKCHSPATEFLCELCSKTFRARRWLQEHQQRFHHEEYNLQLIKCDICEKQFGNQKRLREHMETIHNKDAALKCEICNIAFVYESQRIGHMRIHTKERPFQCSKCPSNFAQSHNLVNHMRIHTGEKPYKCRYCNKAFSDRPTYNRHVEGHEGKIYKCEICSKGYPTRHSFGVHMKSHSDKRRRSKSKSSGKAKSKKPTSKSHSESDSNEEESGATTAAPINNIMQNFPVANAIELPPPIDTSIPQQPSEGHEYRDMPQLDSLYEKTYYPM